MLEADMAWHAKIIVIADSTCNESRLIEDYQDQR